MSSLARKRYQASKSPHMVRHFSLAHLNAETRELSAHMVLSHTSACEEVGHSQATWEWLHRELVRQAQLVGCTSLSSAAMTGGNGRTNGGTNSEGQVSKKYCFGHRFAPGASLSLRESSCMMAASRPPSSTPGICALHERLS
jgi:hypothetical protein